jgi:hypothetical protein
VRGDIKLDNLNSKTTSVKRGRPKGYRLSEESKDKIRSSRFGTHHSEETKNKISRSLAKYFRERDPLSESMRYDYRNFSKQIDDWILDNKKDIDQTEHVMTEKRIFFLGQLEICAGFDIDNFSHETTPEFLILLKEELIEKGLTDELEELKALI